MQNLWLRLLPDNLPTNRLLFVLWHMFLLLSHPLLSKEHIFYFYNRENLAMVAKV